MNTSNQDFPKDREERAIDALIAAALHPPTPPDDIDATEIDAFVGPEEPGLSPEAEAALAKLGPDVLTRILQNSEHQPPEPAVHREEALAEYSGMYRKNPTGDNAPEDEHELEKRRQEALEKLDKGKNQTKDPPPDAEQR